MCELPQKIRPDRFNGYKQYKQTRKEYIKYIGIFRVKRESLTLFEDK